MRHELAPGDYLEVVEKGRVVLAPMTLVNKEVERGGEEGLKDLREGRVYGPFSSATDLVRSLHKEAKKPKAKRLNKR